MKKGKKGMKMKNKLITILAAAAVAGMMGSCGTKAKEADRDGAQVSEEQPTEEEDGSEDAIEEDGAAEEDGATLDEGDSFLREVHAAMETIKASAKAVETNAFIGYFLSK